MKSKYSERVGAVEGGEQEPVSSIEEGGKSDCTNPSAADGNPGGPHGGRQWPTRQDLAGQVKYSKERRQDWEDGLKHRARTQII